MDDSLGNHNGLGLSVLHEREVASLRHREKRKVIVSAVGWAAEVNQDFALSVRGCSRGRRPRRSCTWQKRGVAEVSALGYRPCAKSLMFHAWRETLRQRYGQAITFTR